MWHDRRKKIRATGLEIGQLSDDRFGRFAERFVRVFGMPRFLAGQTVVIVAWVVINALGGLPHFDPYPFIFLNLIFSALAAYAAPFILLAESRQADRDRAQTRAEERHHDELESRQQELLEQDASQTEQIARLLEQDTAQTEHLAQLLEHVHLLLERETDHTDLIASLAAQTVEMAQANHTLMREIRAQTVRRGRPKDGQLSKDELTRAITHEIHAHGIGTEQPNAQRPTRPTDSAGARTGASGSPRSGVDITGQHEAALSRS